MTRCRIFSLLIGATCSIAMLSGVLTSGRPVAGASYSITVREDKAQPDFPDSITFNLTAQTSSPTKQVELLYSLADEETLHVSTPEFTPGTAIHVADTIDMQINQVPPGIDITYHWKLTGEDDSTLETEPAPMLWKDDRFDWQSTPGNMVTVYAYNDDAAFNQKILDTAQRTITKVQSEFGVKVSTPIRIWAYESQKDFKGTLSANSEEWSVGATYPQLNLIVAALPDGDVNSISRVVPHEVTHQILYQATTNPFNHPPRWLDEGLAVLHQENGRGEYDGYVKAAVEAGKLYSVRALNSDFPFDPDDVHLAYAESLSIVQFIIDHFGADKMGALIAAYRQGLSHDEAAQKALGVDLDGLDRLWKDSLGYKGDKGVAGVVQPDGHGLSDPVAESLAYGTGILGLAVFGSLLLRGFIVQRAKCHAADHIGRPW